MLALRMAQNRTRIVLIADDPAKLGIFRQRYAKDPRFQLITTTDLAEGLMLAEAMPADALLVAVELGETNRDRVLDALRKRANPDAIPMHWIGDDATRAFLESDEGAEFTIDTILEDTLPPEEVMSLFTPDAAEEESRTPRRARLKIDTAIERPPASDGSVTKATPLELYVLPRARLDPRAGFYQLAERPLIDLIEQFAREHGNGALQIDHKDQTAQLHFADGLPIHATYGELAGMGALVNFAHWQDGLAQWKPRQEAAPEVEPSLDPAMVVGMLKSIPTKKR